jgi:cyclic-di-GMP-binding protein
MESIKLTIPSQQEGQHILVETDPTKLAEWLNSLPLADMSRTLPEITRAISSLNRTELSYKLRAELVAYFDQSYTLVHDYYRPNFSLSASVRPGYEANIEKLNTFTREMAFAHKIIVNDSHNKRQLWGKNKYQAKASAFAIYYLGLMLIEQYEIYAPIPIYLWREINSLYAHAGKAELNYFKNNTDNSYCLPTVEQNYIRNCLLALADPYHLDRGEHWYLFHYLHHWVHLARISENPDDFRNDECFIIDITSENKPNFVTSELDDPEDPKIRLLLTYDLIRQIKFDLEILEEKDKLTNRSFHKSIKLSTAKYLWEHVIKHWRERIERSARRYPIVSKIDVIWGLSDIIRVLGRISQKKSKVLTSAELLSLTQIVQSDHLSWDAINVSSGGIGLCSRQYMLPHIELGNIALIREYMDGNPAPHWRLAICRWHTGDQNNGTMLGLEYIDGKYTPVRLVLHQGNNERGGQPGLVVSSNKKNGTDAPTLITTEGSYKNGRVYAMLGLDEPVEVRPRLRVEVTPCIDRFFYQTFELRDELAEEVLDDVSDVIPWTAVPHELGNIDDSFDEDEISKSSLDNIRLPGDH